MGRERRTHYPTKMTSVNVFYNLFEEYRSISGSLNFQALVSRTMYLYVHNPKFKKQLDNMKELQTSGSGY